MHPKNLLLIAIAISFLMGCDPQEDMGSNPLRAKAREAERQHETASREQETTYGKAISKSFNESSK